MILGIISDTHKDRCNAIPHVILEFKKRNVEAIVHCGDIEPQHLSSDLFGNLPVICALVEAQAEMSEFKSPPSSWDFTRPGDRIREIKGVKLYVGHKRSFEFLNGAESELTRTLNLIRKNNDEVDWLFSGHTHHQIYLQGRTISFLNPGAIEASFDGYEFATINTENKNVVFGRIPRTTPKKSPFSVGIISDSLNVSDIDAEIWIKLAEEFKKNNVKHVIHCGNIATEDVGLPEFDDFTVYYNLRQDQRADQKKENWILVQKDYPVAEINGYKFYIQLDLGASLIEKSEFDMHKLGLDIRRKYPAISFILCGFTNSAFLEEGEQIRIINPGDVVKSRNFAIVSLPTTEITFSHVEFEPLPPI